MRILRSGLLVSALLAAACDLISPSAASRVYVLSRIGNTTVPVPFLSSARFPLILADTLRISMLPRAAASTSVSRTVVYEYESGQVVSVSSEESAPLAGDLLRLELRCPPDGVVCIGPPETPRAEFKFVGDSLLQQIPAGVIIPVGVPVPLRVYALVRTQ
jgi:hypothetical protein